MGPEKLDRQAAHHEIPFSRITMGTFLLVHGAWHSGWCWNKVIPCLQQSGHRVITPDLPGHGNHPCKAADVTLRLYTDYIREIVDRQPEPVILVGHSMAGIVISEVAEQIPDRIAKLVYLTAFLLDDGQTLLEITQKDSEGLVLPNLVYSRDRRSATVKDSIVHEAFYNDCSPEDVLLAKSRLVPQPLAPLSTPIHVSQLKWGSVPRSYIQCNLDRAVSPAVQEKMQENLPCDQVLAMNTGHSPFLSAAEDLADTLDWLSGNESVTGG